MTIDHPTLPPGVEIKPIPGHTGYFASSDGRIWSRYRSGDRYRKMRDTLLELKRVPSRSGHLRVALASGPGKIHSVHRLILQTFVGPCPAGMECCHDPDPDPANCKLDNLRWDTRQANHDDKCRAGRQARGSTAGRAKLTEDDVNKIRALALAGVSQRELARRFGVDRVSIQYILRRRNWKHLPGPPAIPPRHPMTEFQAATIIRLGKTKMKQKDIARQVGTTQANVSLILLGKSWTSLHENERWKAVLATAPDRLLRISPPDKR